MRLVVQRVGRASVLVEGRITGSIDTGLLILVGIAPADTSADVQFLARKIITLRVFSDALGKMNWNLAQAGGALLVVSNFTLYADTSRGNRPSFGLAAKPDQAESLYLELLTTLKTGGTRVEAGVFGTHMEITMTAEGPVTIVLDSEPLARPSASPL